MYELMSVNTPGCGTVVLWPDRVELRPGLVFDRQSQGTIPLEQIEDVRTTKASRLGGPGEFQIILKNQHRPLPHLTVRLGINEKDEFDSLRLAILNAVRSRIPQNPAPPPPTTPPPPPQPTNPQREAIENVHGMFRDGLITAEQRDAMINQLLGLDPHNRPR